MVFDPDTRELLRTRPNPLSYDQARRLRGARPAGPPPRPSVEPVTAQRRASNTGVITVTGQQIAIGRQHAHTVVTVHVAEHTLTVDLDDGDSEPSAGPPPNRSAATRPNTPAHPNPPSRAWSDHRGHHRWGGAAYGSTPPAPRVLRIADATALRPALDPEASVDPCGRINGRPRPAPCPRATPAHPNPTNRDQQPTRVEPGGPYVF